MTVRSAVRLARAPCVASGIPILRHRLDAIEGVLTRMLVDGALSVMPVGTYRGSVRVLRLVPSPIAGGSE